MGLIPGCGTEILAKKKKRSGLLARKRGSGSSDDLARMTKEKIRMTKEKKQRIKELFCVLMN